jgi:hypothetical protein
MTLILGMCRPVREGALPEAFESGAASARGADPQGSAIAAVASAGEQPVAVDAAPSPSSQGGVSGSSASRSPARNMGAPPGILAAASPVPAKTRVRADALKAPKPAGSVPQGPAGAEVARPGTKGAAREAWSGSGSLSGTHPSHPTSCARPPGASTGHGLPHPFGVRGRLADPPLGPTRPRGRSRVLKPRDRPRAWPRRRTAPRSCLRSGSGHARSHRRGR